MENNQRIRALFEWGTSDFLTNLRGKYALSKNKASQLNYLSQGFSQKKRIFPQLKSARTFQVDLQMDKWRQAMLLAKNIERPRRAYLIGLYNEALLDPHLYSQMEGRILKTIGSPYALYQQNATEPDWAITKLIDTPWMENYMRRILETRFYGHSLIEFGELKPARPNLEVSIESEFHDIFLIPREHVVPELGEILLDPTQDKGLPYRELMDKLYLIEAGDNHNLGLLQGAVREVIWKYYSRTDWSRASEKFGMPLIAMATEGADDDEIDKMEEAAANFGSNGYVLTDILDNVKIIESTKSDAFRVYLEKIKYCDEQNSKLTSGSTSMSDQKSFTGSAQTHERQYNEIIEADKRMLEKHINFKLLPFLEKHGYPVNGYEFRWLELEATDGSAPASTNNLRLKKKALI